LTRARAKDERHRGREAALQILYQWDITRGHINHAVNTFFALQWPDPVPAPDALRTFATDLATETVTRLEPIDALIAETAERWRPERMAILDRLIIRMAVCEFLREPRPPAAVVIDEALELARTFSSDDSVKFVNGILDAIRKKLDIHD
jgi:N utilization substance protein B